jgi:hypothetical protein
MPKRPSIELIPECVDAQLPSGRRPRFCHDALLRTSDAGLLLLGEHAARSGDTALIGTALAPKPGVIICEDEAANDVWVTTNKFP